jgi:hypothetical protein
MTDVRGRETRQEQVRAERRRRDDATIDGSQGRKLAIPASVEKKLAEEGRTARWINDVGSRVHDLTVLDDWDRVEGVEPRDVVIDRKPVTTAKAYLVSKRQDFIAEDRAKKEGLRREKEAAMLKGEVPGTNSQPDNLYADKANKIERGNQIIE